MAFDDVAARILAEIRVVRAAATPSLRSEVESLCCAAELFVTQFTNAAHGNAVGAPPGHFGRTRALVLVDEAVAEEELRRVLRLTALVGGAGRVAYYEMPSKRGQLLSRWAAWVSGAASISITTPLEEAFPALETIRVDVGGLHAEVATLYGSGSS